eukprot:98664_1
MFNKILFTAVCGLFIGLKASDTKPGLLLKLVRDPDVRDIKARAKDISDTTGVLEQETGELLATEQESISQQVNTTAEANVISDFVEDSDALIITYLEQIMEKLQIPVSANNGFDSDRFKATKLKLGGRKLGFRNQRRQEAANKRNAFLQTIDERKADFAKKIDERKANFASKLLNGQIHVL